MPPQASPSASPRHWHAGLSPNSRPNFTCATCSGAGGCRGCAPRSKSEPPPRRWQRFVDDVGLFLDRWAAYAAALGWTPHDLFGCDRDRPFARVDRAGLLRLLNGDRLVVLADDAATIETQTGARQTWRRKLGD